jgi:hypothetical protein
MVKKYKDSITLSKEAFEKPNKLMCPDYAWTYLAKLFHSSRMYLTIATGKT